MKTLTFGPPGSGAQFEGTTSLDLQRAVALVKAGGRVVILPGTYHFSRAVHIEGTITLEHG